MYSLALKYQKAPIATYKKMKLQQLNYSCHPIQYNKTVSDEPDNLSYSKTL